MPNKERYFPLPGENIIIFSLSSCIYNLWLTINNYKACERAGKCDHTFSGEKKPILEEDPQMPQILWLADKTLYLILQTRHFNNYYKYVKEKNVKYDKIVKEKTSTENCNL